MKLVPTIMASVLCAVAAPSMARAQSLLEWHAGQANEALGYSIDRAGDIDQDGVMDTVVGAPAAGTVRVYSGANGAVLRTWTYETLSGFHVAGVGDLDADGVDDIAITCAQATRKVRLVSGATGALLRKLENIDPELEFGAVVRPVGDIDGDGCGEIAIGAPRVAGSSQLGIVFIYSYAKVAYPRLLTAANSTYFGSAIANVGDVDGDGVPDMLVGSPHATQPVRLYSGVSGSLLRSFANVDASSGFGKSVCGLGTIGPNGDPIIAIGDPVDDLKGSVRLFDAVDGHLLDTLFGQPNSSFGARVECTAAADDATTIHDLLVGAPDGNGAVYLFDAPSGDLLHQWTGPSPGSAFGAAIVGLGRRDGDADGEVAIGAWNTGTVAGEVSIYAGLSKCGAITSIGAGCASAIGITPKLEVTGCARAKVASSITLSITNGPLTPSTAFLCVGFGTGHLNLPSGCALYFGQIVGDPIPLPLIPTPGGALGAVPLGAISIAATVPALGYGFDLPLQAIVVDTLAPSGFTTTNAVRVSFMP